MIPLAHLHAWSLRAPWPDLRQVEQDLVICRALCDVFSTPFLADRVAFRGGTAIHKLLFRQPLRYSEDIDLVQTRAEPIGKTVDAVREALSWLGSCRRVQAAHSMHLVFTFSPEVTPESKLKLKVEINTREQKALHEVRRYDFAVVNDWFSGSCKVVSFEPEELFGTKLRALLQRRKSRDLFDLGEGLAQLKLDCGKLVQCFNHYLALEGVRISRAEAEQRMLEKMSGNLVQDIAPLLPAGVTFGEREALAAFSRIWFELLTRVEGERWKLSASVIDQIRRTRYPAFLLGGG